MLEENVPIPSYWPHQLKVQLLVSNSHEGLIKELGEIRASIGVLEMLSKVELPIGGPAIMREVPMVGDVSFEKFFDIGPRKTAKLAGLSEVAVRLSLDALPIGQRNTLTIRNLIGNCLRRVKKDPLLQGDIKIAGRTMSRLIMSRARKSQIQPVQVLSSTRLEELKALEAINQSFRTVPWWWFE